MLAHILAAEFTLDRPQTPLGWLVLALGGATVIWIVTRGAYSLLESFHKSYFRDAFYAILALTLLFFGSKVWKEKKDPLLQGDIEVFVVEGTEATTDPADPGYQPVDPGHSHDGG